MSDLRPELLAELEHLTPPDHKATCARYRNALGSAHTTHTLHKAAAVILFFEGGQQPGGDPARCVTAEVRAGRWTLTLHHLDEVTPPERLSGDEFAERIWEALAR